MRVVEVEVDRLIRIMSRHADNELGGDMQVWSIGTVEVLAWLPMPDEELFSKGI